MNDITKLTISTFHIILFRDSWSGIVSKSRKKNLEEKISKEKISKDKIPKS
jgi:hypothetical protein